MEKYVFIKHLIRVISYRLNSVLVKVAIADSVTTAAAAIPVLRDRAVFAADMVPLALEIIRVAGGTEGCVLGEGPGYRGAYSRAMTAVTARVPAVISRVVSVRVVTENGRCPAVRRMAYVALLGCGKMRWNRVYLAGSGTAVVAGIAIVGATGVVRPGAAGEAGGGMTEVTVQAGRNMRGDRVCFARRGIAIVAGLATAGDTGMVEGCRPECVRVVTHAAILIGRHVADFFRRGETGVVARRAIVHDARVVEAGRLESGGLMAIDAIAVGWDMVGVFTRGGYAVVTQGAIIRYVLVIKRGLGKSRWYVANRAILAADRNMGRIGFSAGAGCNYAVVAGRAGVDDTRMIEYGRLETAPR
jgi:hypothetical protein